jgi:hypothetical protein
MHFQVKNTLKSNYNDTLKKKKIYSTTKAWITAYIKKKIRGLHFNIKLYGAFQ